MENIAWVYLILKIPSLHLIHKSSLKIVFKSHIVEHIVEVLYLQVHLNKLECREKVNFFL